MSKMARTNYWNPSVNYIGKNSAQNFMKSAKAKLIGAGVKVVAADCSCNCSAVARHAVVPVDHAHLAVHLVVNTKMN